MTFLFRHPFTLIFFFALFLRLGYLVDIHDTPAWRWHAWQQSDMHTFLMVAEQIRAQGLLVPHPHHPYHIAHAQTGSLGQWERWLGGEHAFYRVPGYYYFLAFILWLSEGSLLAVKIVQALLGAGHAMLLGLIGQRMIGRRGGIITGILAAAYGPFIAVDAMILREGPGLFLAAAALYQVLRALESSGLAKKPRRIQWLWAGILLGLNGLLREPGLILFGSVWLWSWAQSFRRHNSLPRVIPLLLVCGFVVPFVPAVARNVMVGAQPLGNSAIFAWNFAIANAIDNSSGGIVLEIPQSVAGVMADSGGRVFDVIRMTWQNYEGAHTRLLANWWIKFSTIWSNVEAADNYSYEYLVAHSALLPVLPRFVCIWLPAAAALVLLGWNRLSRRPSDRVPSSPGHSASGIGFAPRTLSLILVFLAMNVALLSVNVASGRYRLLIVPTLLLLTGWLFAQTIIWLQERNTRRLIGLSTGLAMLTIVWWLWPTRSIVEAFAIRGVDFAVAAADLVLQGDPAGARRELQEGIRYCRGLPGGPNGFQAECSQPLVGAWIEFFGVPNALPELSRSTGPPP